MIRIKTAQSRIEGRKIPRYAKLHFSIWFVRHYVCLVHQCTTGMRVFSKGRQPLGTWLHQTFNCTSWDEANERCKVGFHLQNLKVELEFIFSISTLLLSGSLFFLCIWLLFECLQLVTYTFFLPLSGHQPSPFEILPRSLFEHGKCVFRIPSQQSGFLNNSVQEDRRGLDVE